MASFNERNRPLSPELRGSLPTYHFGLVDLDTLDIHLATDFPERETLTLFGRHGTDNLARKGITSFPRHFFKLKVRVYLGDNPVNEIVSAFYRRLVEIEDQVFVICSTDRPLEELSKRELRKSKTDIFRYI